MRRCRVGVFRAQHLHLSCLFSYTHSNLSPCCFLTATEVLLGGCRLFNLDTEKAAVDGVDDLDM